MMAYIACIGGRLRWPRPGPFRRRMVTGAEIDPTPLPRSRVAYPWSRKKGRYRPGLSRCQYNEALSLFRERNAMKVNR